MLETSNLALKYTPISSFRKYIFQYIYLGPLKFADVSIILQKITIFCPKKYLYSKQQRESCVKDFIVMPQLFLRQKITINGKVAFADFVSGVRPPDCSKLAKIQKNYNDTSQYSEMMSSSIFVDIALFLVSIQLLVQV